MNRVLGEIKTKSALCVGNKYKHRKGGIYTLITIAAHTETEEIMVVYQSDSTGVVWCRPMEMFCDGRFEQAG